MKHEKTYASLEAGDEVFDIGINRAVTLIAEKKSPKARAAASAPIPARRSAIIPPSAPSR
ncbi:topoisomerase IA-like protein [Bradyrhizobium sp. LM3.2]